MKSLKVNKLTNFQIFEYFSYNINNTIRDVDISITTYIDVDYNFTPKHSLFNLKNRFFLYFFFMKTRFVFWKKPLSFNERGYSGKHLKNKHNFIGLMLLSSFKRGGKLNLLKQFNFFHNSFYFFFNDYSDFLSRKFVNYKVYYEISSMTADFFNINFLLKSVLELNNSMFNCRVVRLNKFEKKRWKTRQPFFMDVVYLPKFKRHSNILRVISRHTNNFDGYAYWERLLLSFCDSFFLQKDSFIYKRKIFSYQSAFTNSKRKVLNQTKTNASNKSKKHN